MARELLELSADWYWEQDADFRFTVARSRTPDGFEKTSLRRWEFSGAKALSKSWTEHRAELAAHLPFRNFEYSFLLPDGSLRCVSASGTPLVSEDGSFTGYRGVAFDITERWHLRERLAMTLDSLPDGFFILDRNWKILYINARAETLFQKAGQDLVGRNIWDEYPAARDSVFHQKYAEAFRDNTSVEFDSFYEEFNIWVHVRASPSLIGLAVTVSDISQRLQAQEEVRRLNAELERRVTERTSQLEQANQQLHAFSAAVAHDVRAPLATIRGFTEAVLEEEEATLPERSRRRLSRVINAAAHMDELTEGLLRVARISEAGLQCRRVDISALAVDVMRSVVDQDPAHQPVFKVQDGLFAWCDAALMREVLANLLGNAFKFTSGRADAAVEVGAHPSGEHETTFFVRDNGAGFEVNPARLFRMFHRFHDAAQFSGTGVGLAIVERVLALHGGRVWAESHPGMGATFMFCLPLQPVEQSWEHRSRAA